MSQWCVCGGCHYVLRGASRYPPCLAVRILAWIAGSRACVTCFYPSSALSNTSFFISEVISHHLLCVAVWCQIRRWCVRLWEGFRFFSTLFFWLSFSIRSVFSRSICLDCPVFSAVVSGFAKTKLVRWLALWRQHKIKLEPVHFPIIYYFAQFKYII